MFWLVQTIVPIAVVVILPVLIVWIISRAQINKDNKNAEIIIKAIENNSTIDTDKVIEALAKQNKSERQILNRRLLRGCILTFIGIASAVMSVIMYSIDPEDIDTLLIFVIASAITLAVGIAFLVVYRITRGTVSDEEFGK